MARRKVVSQGFKLSTSELDDYYGEYKSIRPDSTMSKKQFAKRVEQSYNYFSRLYEQEKSKGRAMYTKDRPSAYTNQYLNYISVGKSKDIAKQRIRAHIQTTYSEARKLKARGEKFVRKAEREQRRLEKEQDKELKQVLKEFGKKNKKYKEKKTEYEKQRAKARRLLNKFRNTLDVKYIVGLDRHARWKVIISTLEELGYSGGELYREARSLYNESVK